MRQISLLILLIALLSGCASAQPEAPASPFPQPVPATEEQFAAPSPIQQPHTSHEMAEAEPAHVQATIAVQSLTNPSVYSAMPEPRTSISPDAIYLPTLSIGDAPRPQFAPSAPLSSAEETYGVFLPLVISIDQRVLDARAQFDCSQAEVLDAQQCDALLILYALTNGPGWKNSDGWLVKKNPCTWQGLECPQPEYNKMKLLLLSDNNLDGRLPYEIYQLPLTFLRVSDNHLSGSIPPSIELMTDLEEIRLESNQLSGQVPVAIANLPRLRMLWLSGDDKSTLCIPEELRSFVEQLGTGYTPPSGGYCP